MDIIFLFVIFSLYMGGHSSKPRKLLNLLQYYSCLIFHQWNIVQWYVTKSYFYISNHRPIIFKLIKVFN